VQREMIYIALGSNLGDSRNLIQNAFDRIQNELEVPLVKSSLWRSKPVDCPEGSADFINAVVGFAAHVDQDPFDLLQQLQSLEIEFGRPADHAQNIPRSLDLDIILFGDRIVDLTDLTIPHPRAKERAFVILPLLEIAPDLVFPDSGLSINELAAMVSSEGVRKFSSGRSD
jgi:2-amino-4-hydroxy-6-hydroxymethyldihydropteridine diphosphokinase